MNSFKKTLVALAVVSTASPALAATCADRDHVVNALETRFGERLISNARSPKGHVLQVYAADDAKTWSIVVQLADRPLACLAATGRGKEELGEVMAYYR